jgi:glutamate-1-semialdehyde aminotransferase
VLVTDAATTNSGTWQLLDAAGLLAAAGCTSITGVRVNVVVPGDAIASGVPLSYVAERDSLRFDSAETTQVVGDGTGPVVIHKVVTP